MTDTAKTFTNFERTEGKNEDVKASTLLGDTLVSKQSNDILRQQSSANELSFLPNGQDLLSQFDEAPHLPRCEAPTHEKRGAVDVTVDEHGEMFEVKDGNGTTFTKNSDGKWTQHYAGGSSTSDTVVENVQVGSDGKITYDYNNNDKNVHVHYEQNADGSLAYTNEFGKFVYDKDMQLVEAPAGEGHARKFHYTNGQLDQIDGVLGHWDRVEKDGQVSWVNKDNGTVWNGDFKLNIDTLEYRGQNGAAWGFTPWGTDVNQAGRDK